MITYNKHNQQWQHQLSTILSGIEVIYQRNSSLTWRDTAYSIAILHADDIEMYTEIISHIKQLEELSLD